MKWLTFANKNLLPFSTLEHIFDERGYIVWRVGTGGNVELLHIRSLKKGKGKELVRDMLSVLKDNKPYYSVFGFCLASNKKAIRFYTKLGFTLEKLQGPYKKDSSVFFWQDYKKLYETC